MARMLVLAVALSSVTLAHAGSYNVYFDFPNQLLPFDTFGLAPASVLAPAGVYRGPSDTTVLELYDGLLLASDPDGGAAGEYSALAILAQPFGSVFAGGLVAQATVSGVTLENIRDGIYPGLAVGMTVVDHNGGTYLLAAINRTDAGPDYFDNLPGGGVAGRAQLTPGTGYFAMWEIAALTPGTVVASAPIPAGVLGDMVFRINVNAAGVASFYVDDAPIATGHALGGQPDRAGLVVMSWGAPAGNPPYQEVAFGAFQASGPEVPDGGVPGIPMGAWMTTFLTLALLVGTARELHRRHALVPVRYDDERGFRK